MENETPVWANLLISWAPVIVLVGFWAWFMRKGGMMGKSAQHIEGNVAFIDRQEKLLERIAVALEDRNKR
jgi:hypothetical protein